MTFNEWMSPSKCAVQLDFYNQILTLNINHLSQLLTRAERFQLTDVLLVSQNFISHCTFSHLFHVIISFGY